MTKQRLHPTFTNRPLPEIRPHTDGGYFSLKELMGKIDGDPEGPNRLAGVGAAARRCQGAGGGKADTRIFDAD